MANPKVTRERGHPSKRPTNWMTDTDEEASGAAVEKDGTELRLEKILFGDEAGFLDSLQNDTLSQKKGLVRVQSHESGIDDAEDDLDEIADDDLFFLDSGSGALPSALTKQSVAAKRRSVSPERKAAWYDSDDDRLRISLASNTRLRKLRDTEADDVVTGRDYIRRLRRQYERLHPPPKWVEHATARKGQRRVASQNGEESDVSMASDASTDDEFSLPASQPFADLLRSGGALTRTNENPGAKKRRRKLRPEVIDIQRKSDVAAHGPSSIDTMQFHPRYPLLLSAGPSSTIQLHHISPQPPNPNPILSSMHVKGTPVHTAAFCAAPNSTSQKSDPESSDMTQIFFASRRRYFHTWSLSTGTVTKVSRPMYAFSRSEQRTMESFKLSSDGQYMALVGSARKGGGSVNVLSTQTMQWVCSCRIDSQGGIADFAWWRDARGLTIVGKNGEITEYDIDSRRTITKWFDEGAVGTTTIALGGDMGRHGPLGPDRWVAVGSSSGVVNIYDRLEWPAAKISAAETQTELVPRRPKPARVLDHLTTPTSHLTFSADGQMLVMASRWKKNALRLVHLPSCTVYRNWPTDKTPLGRVSSVALSDDGALLALGNEQGKIRLWEIRE